MADWSKKQQAENIQGNAQQIQGYRDVYAFQNSPDAQITIHRSFLSLFGNRDKVQKVDWEWASQLLKRSLQPNIKKRLKDKLLSDVLSEIDLVEKPESVARLKSPPLSLEARKKLVFDNQNSEWIDPHQPIIQIYAREDIFGKLLILGSPGAGKTTTLLTLAEQLITQAVVHPKTIVPVIFELSTWCNHPSIENWMIEQLYENYGGNKKTYEAWIERQVLLPLLDGLDELGLVQQKRCTEQINEFAHRYAQLVVCCRSEEFRAADKKLPSLRGAIQLQPLSNMQIQSFLLQVNREGLWEQIQSTPEMKQLLDPLLAHQCIHGGEPIGLLRIPLFINLAAQVYKHDKPLKGKADLLERYIVRQLSPEIRNFERHESARRNSLAFKSLEQEPSQREVQRALTWLAKQLAKHNSVDFLIEKIQPQPPIKAITKYYYQIFCGLIVGASIIFPLLGTNGVLLSWSVYFFSIRFAYSSKTFKGRRRKSKLIKSFIGKSNYHFGYFYGILSAAMSWILVGLPIPAALMAGAIGGLLYGWIYQATQQIKPIEKLKVSLSPKLRRKIRFIFRIGFRKNARNSLIYVSFLSTLLILAFAFSRGFSELLIAITLTNVITSVIIFILMVIFSILIGLPWEMFKVILILIKDSREELKERVKPNQGIWNSIQNSIFLALPALLILLCILLFSSEPNNIILTENLALTDLVRPIISCLLLIFFLTGGLAFIQHFCLRLSLFWVEKIPFRLTQFLDYCVERRILERIGGRYRFIHREVRDYFF